MPEQLEEQQEVLVEEENKMPPDIKSVKGEGCRMKKKLGV